VPQRGSSARVALALSGLGFLAIGLPDGLLGVAWPSMRASFGLPLHALGPLLVATTAGYVASSAMSGRILAHMSVGALLALSCALTAASLLGYAAAPRFAWIVALGCAAGLGAGAIDSGINGYVATRHGPRSVSALHLCYGVGAAAGPALLTQLLNAGFAWRSGYAAVGAAQLALAAAFAASLRRWPPAARAPREREGAAPAAPRGGALRVPAVRLGIAAFCVYTGIEAAIGAWAYTLLTEARGVAMMAGGAWVSAYWGSLTVGRLLSAVFVDARRVDRVLRGCVLGLVAGSAWLALDAGALASGLALGWLGLCAGPIFPALIATTPARVGDALTSRAVGFQVAAAALGQALLPGALGAVASGFGIPAVAPALLALAALLLAVFLALVRAGARGVALVAPSHAQTSA
jgi:fucose permease